MVIEKQEVTCVHCDGDNVRIKSRARKHSDKVQWIRCYCHDCGRRFNVQDDHSAEMRRLAIERNWTDKERSSRWMAARKLKGVPFSFEERQRWTPPVTDLTLEGDKPLEGES